MKRLYDYFLGGLGKKILLGARTRLEVYKRKASGQAVLKHGDSGYQVDLGLSLSVPLIV